MGSVKRIFIHAGAHRTGTSSFQMCLQQNRATLEEAGYDVSFPGRDGIPDGDLSLQLPSPRHTAEDFEKFAARIERRIGIHSPDPDRAWVFSEENLPGRMIHFFAGQFYPAAEARLTVLRQGLGSSKVARIMLVIRPYADLFISAQRKRAEDHQVDPFGPARAQLLAIDRGWPELITAMRDILRPDQIVVIDYAARGTSLNLLEKLVPDLPLDTLKEPAQRMNSSATDAALEALQQRYLAGDTLERADWQRIIEQHAHVTEDRGFASFTQAQKHMLDARYADSLNSISKLDDVTLIA